MVQQIIQPMTKRHAKTNLNKTQFATTIRCGSDRYHCSFQVGYKVHPIEHRGINLGLTRPQQVEAKARARMCAKEHVTGYDKYPLNKLATRGRMGFEGRGLQRAWGYEQGQINQLKAYKKGTL